MIYKERYIELWVNGNKVELENQKSVNIRLNNVLFDPTKISSTNAEYSFSFEVPCTPNNNIVFDYANNLSKTNKFHERYKAEVYADGFVIFSGTITINGVKDDKYQLNLVSVKVYSLDEIFGDMTMNKIKDWKIDFNGPVTINNYNNEDNPDVVFPLVSYGVFEKNPYYHDNVADDYTSKFDFDEYNAWYVESFYPSHKMLTTLKKAFESVETPNGEKYVIGGDAFQDATLNRIYTSVNLADEQDPEYNVGNPLFGKISMNISWQTPTSGTPYTQTLRFPYWRAGGTYDIKDQVMKNSNWNFGTIEVYNMMSEAEGGHYTLGNGNKSYMLHPNNSIIVIPANGWYKIKMDALATLSPAQSALTATQWCLPSQYASDWEEDEVTIPVSFMTTMPFEIQLVRNYDDNIELITGKNKFFTKFGYPNDATKWNINNRANVTTCFPHERLGTNWVMGGAFNRETAPPTEINDLGTTNISSFINGGTNNTIYVNDCTLGYIYKDNTPMAYDQAVSPAFIAGFTSMGNDNGGGCCAIMKEGYSWSHIDSSKNCAFYGQPGYDRATTTSPIIGVDWDNIFLTPTEYNKNEYIGSPTQSFVETDIQNARRFQGFLNCMVYLNKNDVLNVMAIQRHYENSYAIRQGYSVAAIVNLEIQAATPREEYQLRQEYYGYNSPIEFDTQLNLANFLNNETKVSEWVQSIADAFNLEITQNGRNIDINTKKKINTEALSSVDIDDRVNSAEAESKAIDYPKSMAVKYKIDDDEWGFERSAVINAGGEAVLNRDDWKKYGDSGYTVINLNDDSYVTTTSDKNLNFSYTWYENFNWYAVNSAHTKTSDSPVILRIPCISKYTYMIDGYDYGESMKHDGFGLSQRFWFKGAQASWATNQYVWTLTDPAEQVWLCTPSNLLTNYQDFNINLSYKSTENSILSQYFNINAYLASNFVEIDVYLSADEYNRIKNGGLVHFDSDLYIPVEINGFDPSGTNPTTLKLMKKVV